MAWPLAHLDEALYQLAQKSGLFSTKEALRLTPSAAEELHGDSLDRWLDAAAAQMGVEVESVGAAYAEIDRLLRYAPPALIPLYTGTHASGSSTTREEGYAETTHFLVAIKGDRQRVTILGADGTTHRLPLHTVCAAIWATLEAPLVPEVEQFIDTLALPPIAAATRARRSSANG